MHLNTIATPDCTSNIAIYIVNWVGTRYDKVSLPPATDLHLDAVPGLPTKRDPASCQLLWTGFFGGFPNLYELVQESSRGSLRHLGVSLRRR